MGGILLDLVRVDINCDMGESFGAYSIGCDEQLMPLITSTNIACGFHAGDPLVMQRTVRLAREHGVKIGAHPGFRDLAGFGRRAMRLCPDEIYAETLYQIGSLRAICRVERMRIHHVKPHGALYNLACSESATAKAVASAVADFDKSLILFAPPGSCLHNEGVTAGLRVSCEVFGDRGYTSDGSLVARGQPGALLQDELAAEIQVVEMVLNQRVQAVDGSMVKVQADTICIHGDNLHAVSFLRRIRARLLAEGIRFAAPFTS